MVFVKATDFIINENVEGPEEVEDELIRDSVLEMVSSTFQEINNENEEMQMGDIRKNAFGLDEEVKGKAISRDKYLEEQWIESNKDETGSLNSSDSKKILEEDNEFSDDDNVDLQENGSEEASITSESEIEDDEVEERPIKKLKVDGEPHTISLYTSHDKNIDLKKGQSVRNQMAVWETLLECRIKLQKGLIASNKMYQFQDFDNFHCDLPSEDIGMIETLYKNLALVLENIFSLQRSLLKSSSEAKALTSYIENQNKNNKEAKQTSNYTEMLGDIFRLHKEYQDPVIQKWNDKTRVLSGKVNSLNFSATEQSSLKQIEQILFDKARLIKRTQLKRSNYSILGKMKREKCPPSLEQEDQEKVVDESDPEIFDDDDFYHKLLRDFIEKKASDVTDPHQLGRQWTQLQKMRSKMKRNVDTKASKGRKLRYTVHNKMVNFMAPIPSSSWSDEAEAELFKSLFGKTS